MEPEFYELERFRGSVSNFLGQAWAYQLYFNLLRKNSAKNNLTPEQLRMARAPTIHSKVFFLPPVLLSSLPAHRLGHHVPGSVSFLLHNIFLPALKNGHRITKDVIAAIPSDKGYYRPNGISKSALDLAWHIVATEMLFTEALPAGEFDFSPRPRPGAVIDVSSANVREGAGDLRRELRFSRSPQSRRPVRGSGACAASLKGSSSESCVPDLLRHSSAP
ncbi:MAG: hypothetical protein JOZ32_01615 [Bryobacterales bacterium]|nr:hypothetical protein [Bryobacterales bacterium]